MSYAKRWIDNTGYYDSDYRPYYENGEFYDNFNEMQYLKVSAENGQLKLF
jgi:hypothetical protein|tara:strand:+ start:1474 stop:1623 length:150 start_codon:yes stop_codon:yes gene_type:complete